MNSCSKTLPLFAVDNMAYDLKVFYTNTPPAGAYQGYGTPKGTYGIMMAMAELADKLGDALDSVVSDLDTLETALTSCHEDILAAMSRLRTSVDAAETLVNDRSWPLPKYREMLFIY